MFPEAYFTKFSAGAKLLLLCVSVANSTSIIMVTAQRDSTKKPRLVLAEHPKQELEHWKQSLGRHLPVADCTVLCTSPRGTAGVMLLCVVQRLKGVVAVMFHNVFFFRTEQGVWTTRNYARVFGHWCCHTALPAKGNVVNILQTTEQLILAKFVRACQES